jgi:hypothetical protein
VLRSVLVLGCALLVPALVSTRAAAPSITATWRSGDVAVDGSLAEWPGLERVDGGPAVAAQNDGAALYLAVATNDVEVREQLAMGLVVWLDSTGRKAQTFGVRLEGLTRRPLPGATPDANANRPFDRDLAPNSLDQFDLLGPAKLQRRLIEHAADFGVALAVGVEDGTIVYELQIPLARTDGTPHAVDATPGARIALGLETPADPQSAGRRNRLDDPMNTNPWVNDPYGRYGPYGYGRYFPPPPPEPGSSRQPKEIVIKPMKLMWTDLRLAPAPD